MCYIDLISKAHGVETMGHKFAGEKPDYCEIVDDLPQFEGSSNGELVNDYK